MSKNDYDNLSIEIGFNDLIQVIDMDIIYDIVLENLGNDFIDLGIDQDQDDFYITGIQYNVITIVDGSLDKDEFSNNYDKMDNLYETEKSECQILLENGQIENYEVRFFEVNMSCRVDLLDLVSYAINGNGNIYDDSEDHHELIVMYNSDYQ